MKIYVHPRCSTCKNLIKWLDAHDLSYSSIDILETPPSKAELKQMLVHVDGQLRKLFNTSGQLYRELSLKDKLASMSEKEAFELLSSEGMLIKRPFALGDDFGLVGFREKEWEALNL